MTIRIAVFVAFTLALAAQESCARRLRLNGETDGGTGGAPTEPPAETSLDEHPAHLARLAAFGHNVADFIDGVEANRRALEEGGGLIEQAATVTATVGDSDVKGGRKVSQKVFCPKKWQNKLERTANFVGGGAFGKVYVAHVACDNAPVAVKVQKASSMATSEARLMEGFAHPNVVKAFGHAKGPARGQMSLLMEACSGGDLDGKHTMPPGELARLFYEIFQGVAYLHSSGYVHADLKPENVMLSSKCSSAAGCHSKVADLGLTCEVQRNCQGVAGTPIYMAPELLRKGVRTPSNDLWSLGIMVYKLTNGNRDPSFLRASYRTVDALLAGIRGLESQHYAYKPKDSSAKEQLISKLLVANHHERIAAAEAAELAANWASEEGVSGVRSQLPMPALPACWAREKERADEEEEAAGSDVREITIDRGYSGKAGFVTGLRKGNWIETLQNHEWMSLTYEKRIEIIKFSPTITLEVSRTKRC